MQFGKGAKKTAKGGILAETMPQKLWEIFRTFF